MGTVEWFNPALGVPTVSIAQYGLTFNRAAAELLSMSPFIMLGVDIGRRILLVKPVQGGSGEHADHCIQFAAHMRHGYVRLLSKDLVRFVASRAGMPLGRSMRFVALWDDVERAVTIDLASPIVPVGARKET